MRVNCKFEMLEQVCSILDKTKVYLIIGILIKPDEVYLYDCCNSDGETKYFNGYELQTLKKESTTGFNIEINQRKATEYNNKKAQ